MWGRARPNVKKQKKKKKQHSSVRQRSSFSQNGDAILLAWSVFMWIYANLPHWNLKDLHERRLGGYGGYSPLQHHNLFSSIMTPMLDHSDRTSGLVCSSAAAIPRSRRVSSRMTVCAAAATPTRSHITRSKLSGVPATANPAVLLGPTRSHSPAIWYRSIRNGTSNHLYQFQVPKIHANTHYITHSKGHI